MYVKRRMCSNPEILSMTVPSVIHKHRQWTFYESGEWKHNKTTYLLIFIKLLIFLTLNLVVCWPGEMLIEIKVVASEPKEERKERKYHKKGNWIFSQQC